MSKGSAPTTPSPRYKPYPKYKDSGVEWMGEIPAQWGTKRLKHLAVLNPESLPEDTDPTFEMVYVDIGGVNSLGRIIEGEPLTFASAPSRARRLVRDGDVIVSTVRTYLRAIAPIRNPDPGMIVSTGFAVVRPEDGLTTAYAAYALRAPFFVERVVANSKGVSFPAINESEMATYELAMPPEGEQRAIAAFLDRETAKIDALVAKKEKLIELLQEKRAALITQAVTKGLDPTVPMKDSGLDWIGKIPAHWEAKRIKWAAKMESGHTPDKKIEAYWINCDIPWVSLNDTGFLKDHDYISDTAYMVNALGLANSSARLLSEKAVVFSRDATVGLCAITTRPMAVSQHFIAWLCRPELKPEYLLYVFRSMTQELERLTMGATIMTIGMPDVKTLSTPIPPIAEQEHIVQHIRRQTAQLDGLITRVHDAIDRLKEYRSALISAAVTGKIDVRGEVA